VSDRLCRDVENDLRVHIHTVVNSHTHMCGPLPLGYLVSVAVSVRLSICVRLSVCVSVGWIRVTDRGVPLVRLTHHLLSVVVCLDTNGV
jgi:hypothetical protein